MPTSAEMLAAWEQAEYDIALYGITNSGDGRSRTDANLTEIKKAQAFWRQKINDETRAGLGDRGPAIRIGRQSADRFS